MIRNKFAKYAKETKNRLSSFKINQKVCAVLAAGITLASVGVSANKFDSMSNKALALSENTSTLKMAAVVIPNSATDENGETAYNKSSFCKVTIIKHGGNPQVVLVRKNTVKRALEASHTTLNDDDVMNAKLSDRVYDGMKIIINKVKYKNKNVTEKISYKKFEKKYPDESTSNLVKGSKVLVNKTVKVKYVNGEKKKETLKSISYESVGVNKTGYYGTEEPGRTTNTKLLKNADKYSDLKTVSQLTPEKDFELDKNGIPVNYKKKITGTASAYSCGTHTATGKAVKPGYIAVNPKQIPYGTKLFIRTPDGSYVYGYASAEDTGGFVAWGNTVADLYMSSNSQCISFGRRTIEIYILD